MNKTGVIVAGILGTAAVVAAILIYESSVKTASAVDNATAGTSNANKLAGQVSTVLSSLGVQE